MQINDLLYGFGGFGDLFGPQGSIMASLGTLFPGAYGFLIILSLGVFFLFFREARQFHEEPQKTIKYYLILGLFSMFLFGNLLSLLIIGLVLTGVFYVTKMGWDRASSIPQGVGNDMQQFGFANEEQLLAGNLTRASEVEEVERASKDDGAKDEAEEEELLIEEEMQQNAIAAESAKLAYEMQLAVQTEANSEKQQDRIMQSLETFTKDADGKIAQMSTVQGTDAQLVNYAKQVIGGMSQAATSLASSEKTVGVQRKKLAQSIGNDVGNMKTLFAHCKTIEAGAEKVAGKMTGEFGQDVLNKIKKKLQDKQAALERIKKQAKQAKVDDATRQALNEQIGKLRAEIEQHKLTQDKAKVIKTEIGQFAKQTRNKLKEARTVLAKANSSDDSANKHSQKIIAYAQAFDKQDSELELAAKQFEAKASLIKSQNATTTLPEQMPIEITINLGQIFKGVIDIQSASKDFFEKEAKPFVHDIRVTLDELKNLNPILNSIHTGMKSMHGAFNQLVTAAQPIIGDSSNKTMKDVEAMLEQTQALAVTDEQKRETLSTQTDQAFAKLEPIINTEIQNIVAQEMKAKQRQESILRSLNGAFEQIIKHKMRVDETFQQKADQVAGKMAQAVGNMQQSK